MQFKASSLAIALAAIPALAQDLTQLPTCAEGPALQAISSTNCQETDFSCICKDSSFLQSLEPQIQAACSPADLQKAIAFAQSTCQSAGVTLSIPPVTATSSASSSAAASSPAITSSAASSGAAASSAVTSGLSLGPGPIVNVTSALSAASSAVSAATSLAASIASSNATNATATAGSKTGSKTGSTTATGTGSGSSASGSSTASASSSAGAGNTLVQGGAGLFVGVLGAMLAL